ncbi:MAG TPA: alpha/beta fold hydrolase [Solirubrobacteraceae bacterium]|nr:alpha/beta fold hydrolase [Solirubrobacteraceae bacterium]
MRYHRQGRGEPLVLIHGVGHHWHGWRPVIDRLDGEFDVIATDSPGFGRSAPLPPGVEPDIRAYADAFIELFAELRLERPHVAGNSMGGAIALELARRGVVRSATAISPVGFWTDRERRFCQLSLGAVYRLPPTARAILAGLTRSALARAVLLSQLFARGWRLPAPDARRMVENLWASPATPGALRAFERYRFSRPHELRATPVTIAWGTRDRLLIYARQAPRARALLPWATHVPLPGLGHTPFWDDPGMVSAVVRAGTCQPAQ